MVARYPAVLMLLILAACGDGSPAAPSPGATPPADPALPYLVKDINPGPASSRPTQLVSFNGRLYFAADDGRNGAELWTSDGSADGTRLLKDLCPGACSSSPQGFLAAHGRLYFAALEGDQSRLWITDGTADGTRPFLPQTGRGPLSPSDLVLLGPFVLFAARDPAFGTELWRTDGTPAGTVMVADLAPGPPHGVAGSANQPDLWVAGGQVFFPGNDDLLGAEPWRTDGTGAGTRLVKDIFPGARPSVANFAPAVWNDVLYLPADDDRGAHLWRSDGTPEGTWSLGAPANRLFPDFRVLGSFMLFAGIGETGSGFPLSRTDGTLSGTTPVRDVTARGLMDYRGTVFFEGRVGTTTGQNELWRTDGTPQGTALFMDINPGSSSSFPQGLSVFGGWLFLAASDGVHGQELWRSDGTPEGTVMVADLNPGTASGLPAVFYRPANLVHGFGDRVYFFSTDGSSGEELWAYRPPPPPR